MSNNHDLTAYDPNGQLTMIVEVKGRTGTSRSWATKLRCNIMEHGLLPNSRYFLLALPDVLYLWKDAGNCPDLIEPTYEIDANPLFQPYFQKGRLEQEKISSESFQIVVTAWLSQLVHVGLSSEVLGDERILAESGLLNALKGGRIELELPS